MAKFRKYALIALAIVAFLTLMFLLYKGTQRNEATPGRTATPSVSTSPAPVSSAPVQTPQVSEQSAQAAPAGTATAVAGSAGFALGICFALRNRYRQTVAEHFI